MQNKVFITYYDAICNLGNEIGEIFQNAIIPEKTFLTPDSNLIKGESFYFGKINCDLPEISDENFNTRCNRLLLYLINKMSDKFENLLKKNEDRYVIPIRS